MYQYSLDSFVTFFIKSISKAKPSDTVDGRVLNLRDALRMTIFTWVSRGLFERHKLIFLSQLAFNLMKRGTLGEDSMINELHFQFLLRGPRKQVNTTSTAVAGSLLLSTKNNGILRILWLQFRLKYYLETDGCHGYHAKRSTCSFTGNY